MELIVIKKENAMQVFTDANGLNPFVEKIKQEVKTHIPDLSTDKGRKAIASLAAKVAKSKIYLDGVGKELVSEWKKNSKLVDNSRKAMREELDLLKIEARRPLTEYEDDEKVKQMQLAEKLKIEADHNDAINDNELFDLRADKVKRDAEEQARLDFEAEKLRVEAEEKAKKEREESIVREAQAAALKREEQAIKDKIDAQKLAEQAESDRIVAEAQAKRDAKQAEINRVNVEKQAEINRIEAEGYAKLQAKQAAEYARQVEIKRQADEKERLESEKTKLESDKKHAGSVRCEIKKHLMTSCKIDEPLAKEIVLALLKIDRITINY